MVAGRPDSGAWSAPCAALAALRVVMAGRGSCAHEGCALERSGSAGEDFLPGLSAGVGERGRLVLRSEDDATQAAALLPSPDDLVGATGAAGGSGSATASGAGSDASWPSSATGSATGAAAGTSSAGDGSMRGQTSFWPGGAPLMPFTNLANDLAGASLAMVAMPTGTRTLDEGCDELPQGRVEEQVIVANSHGEF